MPNLTEQERHVVTYWDLLPFEQEEPTESFHTNELIAIIDRLSAELTQTRKARLEELLAAEAAERVEVAQHNYFTTRFSLSERVYVDLQCNKAEGKADSIHFPRWYGFGTVEEAEAVHLCLSAALAEKRKRERGVGL